MVLPTKIYINFHTQVFNTFSRISGIEITESGETSRTIKYLPDIFQNPLDIAYICLLSIIL